MDPVSGEAPASNTPSFAYQPMVSCIMPTRDRRSFVAQAIAYFARQDYPNRELIVVDDGNDAVADLAAADPRVRYVALPGPATIGAKRNRACDLARGEIIAHWDDDDWYGAARLAHQVAPLLAGRADITGLETPCFFDLEGWRAWGVLPALHARLFVGDVHGGTLVFWRHIWEKLARYPEVSLAEDAMFLRAARTHGARLEKLPAAGTFVYVRHRAAAWRLTPGAAIDRAGWFPVDPAAFIPPGDLSFYEALSPAAPTRKSAGAAPPAAVHHAAVGTGDSRVAPALKPAAPAQAAPDHALPALLPAEPIRRPAGPDRLVPAAIPQQAGGSGLPPVTCIMPTANRRAYVAQAIRYFLRQDYPARELLIVDDGDDPVADLIPADPRIRYERLPRRLVLGAKRNLACEAARGEIIAHWDDDDWSRPDRLSYQLGILTSTGAALCGNPCALYYDPYHNAAWLYRYPPMLRRWLAGNTLCYRKDHWARHPFPEIAIGEDVYFVWGAGPDEAVATPDHTYHVALLHPHNTSPKAVSAPYWRPHPVAEIHAILGPDLEFYEELGTRDPPFLRQNPAH